MRLNLGVAMVVIAAFVCGPAAADGTIMQPLVRPDPSTVTVPDMAFTPTRGDIDDYDDYFYFYKAGVSYEKAFADLDLCRLYAASARLAAPVPRFLPLRGETPENDQQRRVESYYMQYGVAGSLIAGWIVAAAEEDASLATTRRCMAYKGYSRFGTSKAIWKQIDEGTDAEKTARRAAIASGSAPTAEVLQP